MPDPKLQAVMRALRAVLQEHDVAGLVILSSRTHLEFLHYFDCTWSCIHCAPNGIRFTSLQELTPDANERTAILSASIGTLAGFIDCARDQADQLEGLLKSVGAKVNFNHQTSLEKQNKPPETE